MATRSAQFDSTGAAVVMGGPAIEICDASLSLDGRPLWRDLNLSLAPGEILAVLGANGSGKTTLLRALLGLVAVSSGTIRVGGQAPRRGNSAVGYVPQQKSFDSDLPIRGRDLVRMGLDGHRFGLSAADGLGRKVDQILEEVGAMAYADSPIGLLSGGEQQRLRIAQALISDPQVLLLDEPLLSLDLSHQQAIIRLIDERRRRYNMAVVFVTHEINPVLPVVDRVLYLAAGRWAVGRPDEVFTTERLSALYGSPVDVLTVRGRIVVVNTGENVLPDEGTHHPGGRARRRAA